MMVSEACVAFLGQHEASRSRRDVLVVMLGKACRAFGDEHLEHLGPETLARWRASMPPATRWQATQALKQVSAWALRWDLIGRDPLARVPNPRPRQQEYTPFRSWDQLASVADQLPPELRLLPWVGAGCGLRPGELLGLDWSAVDLDRGELHVRQSVHERQLRSTLKTPRSRRAVPIRARVAAAIGDAAPSRPAGLVFATRSGAPLDLRNLRARAWRPALQRAGLAHPHRIYDLRHTYATWSLRAGVGVYQLARRMGTSVDMIDLTYGHLAADAAEHERRLLDAWDVADRS